MAREKSIIKTFPRKFTPRSATKVAHKLGRKKQWVIKQQKRLVSDEKLSLEKPKFLSEFFKIPGENSRILKNVSKGCEYKCGGKGKLVTCPSCGRFKYHIECLKKMFEMRKKPCVDFNDEKWKCVHC